jgi:hypothetical protein
MAGLIPGYEYDILIAYHQKSNKGDSWVTEFDDNLYKELEANIKDKISVYLDAKSCDGLPGNNSIHHSLEHK